MKFTGKRSIPAFGVAGLAAWLMLYADADKGKDDKGDPVAQNAVRVDRGVCHRFSRRFAEGAEFCKCLCGLRRASARQV